MRLGFLSSELIDIPRAAKLGFPGLELQAGSLCAPDAREQAELRQNALALCATHKVEITAIAFYDLAWTPSVQKDPLPAYLNVFDAAEALGVQVITSMSGFDSTLDWEGNLALFQQRFVPIVREAENRGLKLALENWLGVGGPPPQKPSNFGGSPAIWDALFEKVPSAALGIEFDPSHLYWQHIDHIRALREYAPKVFHVHAKDTEFLPEELYRWGHYGTSYRFRIPGRGEIDWPRFVGALDEVGYNGGIAIEHEDPIYHGERFEEGLQRGRAVLFPLVYPEVVTL